MPSNDDDSGNAATGAASATTSFNNNFFPESRPPNTITSSVHKKFNLVEAIANHQAHAHAEMGVIDRILAWAFEVLIIVLLVVLVHKFVRRAMQERNVENVKRADEVAKDQQKCIPVDQSSHCVATKTISQPEQQRDSLRFQSRDLKCVKKRKWVSTGPIMAHGRDLSLSPDKKWLNLRSNNLLLADNPMLNPLPLLRSNKEKAADEQRQKEVNDALPQQETTIHCTDNGVMEIKLHIPVSVTVENIYNLKNFNVC